MTSMHALADLIEKGLNEPRVREGRVHFLREAQDGSLFACALGAALVGKFGVAETICRFIPISQHYLFVAASALEIGVPLACRINGLHAGSNLPAAQIAMQLREGIL